MKNIIGHDKIIRVLRMFCANKRDRGFFIFSGAKSIGKYTLCKAWMEELNPSELFDVNVSNGGCSVDALKNILSTVHLVPTNTMNNTGRGTTALRCIIVDDADRLSLPAFNMLLKVTEELPSNNIIAMITSSISTLPKTLVSRAMKLNFNMLLEEEIRSIMCLLNIPSVKLAVTCNIMINIALSYGLNDNILDVYLHLGDVVTYKEWANKLDVLFVEVLNRQSLNSCDLCYAVVTEIITLFVNRLLLKLSKSPDAKRSLVVNHNIFVVNNRFIKCSYMIYAGIITTCSDAVGFVLEQFIGKA